MRILCSTYSKIPPVRERLKIPIIPLVVAGTLIAVVVYLFNSASSGKLTLGEARVEKLADLEGVESEVAVTSDGSRLVAIASGDLWLFNIANGSRQRITQTAESESFPAWAPDGKRLTFTLGNNTYVVSSNDFSSNQLLKENAVNLSWSATGRQAYVRNRTLWITDAAGLHDHAVIEPDENPDVTVIQPRFSPDSSQVSYIKSTAGLHGEVWLADAHNGTTRSLVADRRGENPLDTGWLADGDKIVYLTNRSGAYGLWMVDLTANTIFPLTGTLNGVLPDRIGMAIAQDRIFVPRLGINSDITISDGTTITRANETEFEPAASRDGRVVAYTIQKGNKNEIWTVGLDGQTPTFRALGTQPRFSPNGFEVVYTHTDIEGRVDLRKLDIRDASSETITAAAEIDFEPDWSPDGRTITFASDNAGSMAIWSAPSTGGKRVGLNVNGYYPRFSPDGRWIAYWNRGALWTMDREGKNSRSIRDGVAVPTAATWVKGVPKIYSDLDINGGKAILPTFDVLPDGRLLTATIVSQDTALWTVNLTYVAE
jgi:Tol biopolymer transport system component